MQPAQARTVPLGEGVVGLVDLGHLPADAEDARRRVRDLVKAAFADGAHRVEAQVPVADRATRILLQHNGLRPEGVARGAALDGAGHAVDVTRLARLRDDPAPGTPQAFLAMLNASLPTKRLIAQGLIRDGAGRVLLCELTYKRDWDLPGGVADGGESPAQTLAREVAEEFGVELPIGRLLAVDWLPPYRQWADALLVVFDLGEHPGLIDRVRLQPSELRALHWVTPQEAEDHVAPYVARLLSSLVPGVANPDVDPIFLEDGLPRPLG